MSVAPCTLYTPVTAVARRAFIPKLFVRYRVWITRDGERVTEIVTE
nr:hypothetical protein [uncultured Rhodopila sp.]